MTETAELRQAHTTMPLQSDPSALWLAWEAKPPQIDEGGRSAVEALCSALLAKPEPERRQALRKSQWRSPELVETILEKSAVYQVMDPGQAKSLALLAGALAARLLHPSEDSSRVSVYLARAHYLAGNASRLLGNVADAEIAFASVAYHFADSPRSLDRAFNCRALALLRWEQGRLDEAGALLAHAVLRFQEREATEEQGTTLALLGLLDVEKGQEVVARVALKAALKILDPERRPWLTVRVLLALALVLASRDVADSALAVLQEFWRLSPRLTESREQVCLRWWEGRVLARLGDDLDAGALLGSSRWSYVEQRRVPEAALVSMDGMVFHAEAGRAAVAYAWADELVTLLCRENGADAALAAVQDLRLDIEAKRRDLRGCAVVQAASLRRILRFRGFRIDPLPFA